MTAGLRAGAALSYGPARRVCATARLDIFADVRPRSTESRKLQGFPSSWSRRA